MSVTSDADLVRQDAATLSSALSAGDITSVELTQACLNRISAVDGTDPRVLARRYRCRPRHRAGRGSSSCRG